MHWMQRILSGISACLFAALTFFMPASAVERNVEQAEPTGSTIPDSLAVERLEQDRALITARFPHAERGSNVSVPIGDEEVVLWDNGEHGDREPGDGVFSIETGFDFRHFTERNMQLAESEGNRESPLFSPGGRQRIGTQTMDFTGEHLLVRQHIGEEQAEFKLPVVDELIRPGQPIPLPLLARPLGASGGASGAPASIPDSLMITKLSVVNDASRTWHCTSAGSPPSGNPTGDWTFWRLMENINNGTSSTSDYIKQFFEHWMFTPVINSFPVNARPNVYQQVIEEWEMRSGGPGASLLPGESPFRLLGIVLRLDLRGGGGAYGGGDAGEGRFVFSLHDGECNNRPMTVILEYKVPLSGCEDVRDWAQRWKALATSSNYNADLAALTQVFAAAGANPDAPNQSAIGQVRTNEFLAGSPFWELREFFLPDSGGFLVETDVKQEPDTGWNNSALLADYVDSNWPAIYAGTHDVPLIYAGDHFRAASAPAPQLWNSPNSLLPSVPTTADTPPPATVRDNVEFQLALNTCSGCHTVETGTSFAHLDYNSPIGSPAILSGFLTGTTVPDARDGAIPREFDDLARRAGDLDDVAAMACPTVTPLPVGNLLVQELTLGPPLKAVH